MVFMASRRAAMAVAALALASSITVAGQGPVATAASSPATTVLVNTATGTSAAHHVVSFVAAHEGRVLVQWPQIGVSVVTASNATALVAQLRHDPAVLSAGLSGQVQTVAPRAARSAATTTRRETPGAIVTASRSAAANRIATGRGVAVMVADTGVLDDSSELRGRVDGGIYQAGHDMWRPTHTTDWYTHGTEVASVVAAARDGLGVVGVAPQATIVATRVVSDDGNIYPESSICAAMAAAAQHVSIANHSYGLDTVTTQRHTFYDPSQQDQKAIIDAVDKAFAYSRSKGVLNIVAAGNAGEDQSDKPHIELPASKQHQGPVPARLRALLGEVPSVMGVSESMPDGEIAGASTVGFGIVDISSVGSGLMADGPGAYEVDAGTSFAAPAVAGAAALVKQLRPTATPDQLESILERGATPVTCAKAGDLFDDQPCRMHDGVTNFFGHGHLDALAAVRIATRK